MAPKPKLDELGGVLQACRSYFVTALIFSLAINLLYLASPLYMLQVYDRVVSSASQVTLVMLTILLLMTLAALASLDSVRARLLTRASIRIDRLLASRVVTATVEVAARGGAARSQPLRDFDTFRQFITGSGIHAVFDLPWAPIYIGVIFMLHPLLGSFALGCAIVLVLMALLNEHLIKIPLAGANEAATRNYAFTDMSLRNAEVVQAMGMMPGLLQRWSRDRNLVLERQSFASDRAATTSSIIRFLRLAMQSMILGLGAYLVIEHVTTVGSMFAASILLGVPCSRSNKSSVRGETSPLHVEPTVGSEICSPPILPVIPRWRCRGQRVACQWRAWAMSFRAATARSCGMSVFASNRPMCWGLLVRPGRANPRWRAKLSG